MTPAYAKLKRELLTRYPLCEICGVRQATQVNHCLYHPYKEHGGIYDTIENCQAVCAVCHNTKGHTRAAKVAHWEKRAGEGYAMTAWNRGVPASRREEFV